MNLGLVLAIGESLGDLKKKGQLKRLINYNVKSYSRHFDKVYIFSYKNDKNYKLPRNCTLVSNEKKMNRFVYSLCLPFIKNKEFKDCDVIRGLQITGGIPAIVAKMFFGKKFAINYGYSYTKFARIENKKLQSYLFKVIEMPMLKAADKVIVTSSEIYSNLSKKINKKKLSLIPNGVDSTLFKPLYAKKSSGFTVMFIGRLERQKNLENLVLAAERISKIKIILVGDGSLKARLKLLSKRKKVAVKIIPPVDYEEIPKKLSMADVFAFPSLVEGNPKILLEAMSCQKAVMGSNVEGIRELIINKYTGILTGVDSGSIRSGLVRLMDAKLREKLGKQARKFVTKNYDIDKLLEKENQLLLLLAK